MTSLLWATVAETYGKRVVLFISLFGSAVTCSIFGTSTSLKQAITTRLLQGVFAGAIGVARSSVPLITDATNGAAWPFSPPWLSCLPFVVCCRGSCILYPWVSLGSGTPPGLLHVSSFCWGFGGVAGAIIGGSCTCCTPGLRIITANGSLVESPVLKWPSVFTKDSLFGRFPYLLPCLIASSVTMIGAATCLFLGPDGGPREQGIALPVGKNRQDGSLLEDSDEHRISAASPGWPSRLFQPFLSSDPASGEDSHARSAVLSLAASGPGGPLSSAYPGSEYHLNSRRLRDRLGRRISTRRELQESRIGAFQSSNFPTSGSRCEPCSTDAHGE